MIARIVIPLLVVIVLSDLYIDVHYFRRRYSVAWWMRLLWWVPCIGMAAYTIGLASIKSFAPADPTWLNTYLLLLGLFVGPKAIFALCSFIGSCCLRLTRHPRFNGGHYVGIVLGIGGALAYVYGLTVGFSQVKVTHITLRFATLPPAFDGYKIVHISDLHLGSFYGWRQKVLQAEMDSIRRQGADLIVFTGDLQNMRPEEIAPHARTIAEATRGAVAVLGNHDDATYDSHATTPQGSMRRRLAHIESHALGWRPLLNASLTVRRDGDSIVIAGMENDGEPPFASHADVAKTLRGVSPRAFVVMLEHDPSAWQRTILPHTQAQLTLSGHTHGGQMQLFGHRPTEWKGTPDKGLYADGGRYLYVNAGLGGLVPFRLNMPAEITVITLKQKTKHNER